MRAVKHPEIGGSAKDQGDTMFSTRNKWDFLIAPVVGVFALVVCFHLGEIIGDMFPVNPFIRYMFTPPQEIAIAVTLFALGFVLRFLARFTLQDLLLTVVLGEALIVVVVHVGTGDFWANWAWAWEVTRFSTLPFLIGVVVCVLMQLGAALCRRLSRAKG